MPSIVHSTWRIPFSIAAREFATARPISLWQWTLAGDRVAVGHLRAKPLAQRPKRRRKSVTHRVGKRYRGRSGVNCGAEQLSQDGGIRSGRILRGEGDMIDMLSGVSHRSHRLIEGTLPGFFGPSQKIPRRWAKDIDARFFGPSHAFDNPSDVFQIDS